MLQTRVEKLLKEKKKSKTRVRCLVIQDDQLLKLCLLKHGLYTGMKGQSTILFIYVLTIGKKWTIYLHNYTLENTYECALRRTTSRAASYRVLSSLSPEIFYVGHSINATVPHQGLNLIRPYCIVVQRAE
uniref:Uncharacterized protein n=1 Tax=Trichogramma kaykai TaxID=54128 RepID=A0ABD2W638_9HYME